MAKVFELLWTPQEEVGSQKSRLSLVILGVEAQPGLVQTLSPKHTHLYTPKTNHWNTEKVLKSLHFFGKNDLVYKHKLDTHFK